MLITGVSGLLGNNLARYFRGKYQILGLYSAHPVRINGIQTKQADICQPQQILDCIRSFRPDIVVHCASLTDVDFCEAHEDYTRQVNVLGCRSVSQALDLHAKLIYISTDSVYGGTKGDYRESDPVNPQNLYGLTKFEGEMEVLKRKNSLVLRTNIFGWNIQDKSSIAEWILGHLRKGQQINGFKNAIFSSIYTFELAKIIDAAIARDLNGTYNCASRDSLSKYEFALRLAEKFGIKKSLVNPISIDDFGFKAKRGKNLGLNINKISWDLNLQMPSIEDSIKCFYNDYKSGLSGKIKQENRKEKPAGRDVFIPYGRQTVDEDDINAVVSVLRSDWITQGPKIKEFEDALCAYTGAKYAVSVANGTAALHVACLAAEITHGDEVITSALTFAASANCVLYCSGQPVFVDINPDTANIDPVQIKKNITQRTKAIIPVHFAGLPCELLAISRIARKYGLIVIEDAAHALGAEYRGERIGSCKYSDMVIFSFHPVKTITTAEGGAVLTNNRTLYEKLLMYRNHGITKNKLLHKPEGSWYYEMQRLGFNYRLTDIQAALGLSQLKKIDLFLAARRRIARQYDEAFANNRCFSIPPRVSGSLSAYHLYPIRLKGKYKKRRNRIFAHLRKKGLGVQVHYIPVYLHPYYEKLGFNKGSCPLAEEYYQVCVSLPIFPSMRNSDISYVIETVLSTVKRLNEKK